MASEIHIPSSWPEVMHYLHEEGFPPGMIDYHAACSETTSNSLIRHYAGKMSLMFVPGDFQTPDFARELISHYDESNPRKHALGIRLARSTLLQEAGVRIEGIISEIDKSTLAATAEAVGPAVLRSQLEYLAQEPTHELRIVPKDAVPLYPPVIISTVTLDTTVQSEPETSVFVAFERSRHMTMTNVTQDEFHRQRVGEFLDQQWTHALSTEESRNILLDMAHSL